VRFARGRFLGRTQPRQRGSLSGHFKLGDCGALQTIFGTITTGAGDKQNGRREHGLQVRTNRTTPGQRGLYGIDRSELLKGRPVKSLLQGLDQIRRFRNNYRTEQQCVRTGGGAKRLSVSSISNATSWTLSLFVARIEYDPNRTAFIA